MKHPKTALVLLLLGFIHFCLFFTYGLGLIGFGHGGAGSHLVLAGNPSGYWIFAWITILQLANSERRWARAVAGALLLVHYVAIMSGDELRFDADWRRLPSGGMRGWYVGLIAYWIVIQLVAWLLIVVRDDVFIKRRREPGPRTKR